MPLPCTTIRSGLRVVAGAALLLVGMPLPPTVALADPAASVSAAGVTLTSVAVELPSGDRMFPDAPGADAVNNTCLACHSAGMVLDQPAMSRAAWQAEVTKMRTAYKAPIEDANVPAIVDYLARLKPGR